MPISSNRRPAAPVKIVERVHSGIRELHITSGALTGVRRAAKNAGAAIVSMSVFGPRFAGPAAWPVTQLRAGPSRPPALTGVSALAIHGAPVEPLWHDGRVIGTVYDDGQARHCYLGDLWPADNTLPRGQQARAAFELMETGLRQAGMTFRNVVRTWFYLDRLLEWYAEFNRVRNQFFRERRVFDGLVPASTGIGAANVANRVLIASAYAIAPRDPAVQIKAVPSPLQGPALQYGSSFSRAVEVNFSGRRALYLSGTASIAPDGQTAHAGDVHAQIDLTMRVVAAILESRQMNWWNVTRSLAYFRHAADAPAFRDWLAAHELSNLPVITVENDVCRDDLLFEIEADAIQVVG